MYYSCYYRSMKIYVSHASSYNYEEELYAPLTKLLSTHELFLPHAANNIQKKAELVLPDCDLILAEVSHPSTGQGIELGIAHMLKVPIICVHKSGSKPSGSLKFITQAVHEYNDLREITKLSRLNNL